MRIQLRPFYTPRELAIVYARRYNHRQWDDHVIRVKHTAELLAAMQPTSVADLSCGDGEIVIQAGLRGVAQLGDYTSGWPLHGPIEKTLAKIDDVDVFVCSETLEHVEDPDGLLKSIRGKARRLLLSTPIGERTAENHEHYWGWEVSDVEEMLERAGWSDNTVEVFEPDPDPYYVFQIWTCR